MSASDAVILLVADGLVAAGRVLGRFRRPCAAERRADDLAAFEADREVLEPGELNEAQKAAEKAASKVGMELGMRLANSALAWRDQEVVRSAAVSRPAADNTTTVDHLEAAWHYHTGAVGYAAMRAGGVEWFCEGCNWSGPTKQAHARHRFQVLADMKNATTRVQEQLGGTA